MMVNRISNNAAREIDKLNEKDSFAALDAPSQLRFSQNSKQKKDYPNDDLIVSLANAYENKRARQVGEWERAQGRYVYTV